MARKTVLDGNGAVAEAMRQINPEVVAAYPITPSTYIMEKFSELVANGEVDTELICAESEHSAMSACVGAAASGGRVMTATASQGLALMHEVLFVAASLRLPIVLICANRSLSGPLNIHGDQSDSLASRDCGFIQIYSENAQEAYDNTLQAILISEDLKVRTPVMVNLDGFITTHKIENIQIEDDEMVRKFIGKYRILNSLLDIEKPVTYGAWARPDYYFEHKRNQLTGLENAPSIIEKVGAKFSKVFGREYGLIEEYKLKDADYALVVMGSAAGTIKDVIDNLRKKKVRVGLLKIRVFRPFPALLISQLLSTKKTVAVLDRASPSGAEGGVLFNEIRSAIYERGALKPLILNYIYGLGGRELYPENIEKVIADLRKNRPFPPQYLNLRE